LNLKKFTYDLMAEMQRDLGTRLEWVAAEHNNTEYPHVHVALRGIDEKGRPFRMEREYIQHGIRRNAEDLATARPGYRTRHDAEEAQRREIHQKRYTSLDRTLTSDVAEGPSGGFIVDLAERKSQIKD
jgi:type IV secretory pathway VirD2 relaxase